MQNEFDFTVIDALYATGYHGPRALDKPEFYWRSMLADGRVSRQLLSPARRGDRAGRRARRHRDRSRALRVRGQPVSSRAADEHLVAAAVREPLASGAADHLDAARRVLPPARPRRRGVDARPVVHQQAVPAAARVPDPPARAAGRPGCHSRRAVDHLPDLARHAPDRAYLADQADGVGRRSGRAVPRQRRVLPGRRGGGPARRPQLGVRGAADDGRAGLSRDDRAGAAGGRRSERGRFPASTATRRRS